MKRVLIVSLNFPPSTIASVHRARHMAKYLPAHAWKPLVLAVDEAFHKEPHDLELGALVPPDVEVQRIGALPYGLTRLLGLGDLSLRSMPILKPSLDREIDRFRPNVVFITGWPFYQMLLSRHIRVRYGLPVVLDFQDPWVSREGATRRRLTKGWWSHQLAKALEPRALRAASWITSVSDRQNLEMAERYPWLDASRMSAIPIGGDPEDFVTLRGLAPNNKNGRSFTFSYVGTALPRSTPLLEALFRGLSVLLKRNPAIAARLAFRFVGTSNQAGRSTDYRVMHLAQAAGVAEFVVEEPGRVPYLDALRVLASTDATLMIGSDEPHYTASKIYPCLMSGRPFLSLFHPESSAHSILAAAGGGVPLAFSADAQAGELERAVADAIERIVLSPRSIGSINPTAFADYTAHAVAGKFADVFERAGA